MIELGDTVAEADRRELMAVRAEGISFENLRACFQICLMDAKDGFGLRGIQLVEAALRAENFVEHGAHGSVGDKDGIAKALIEFFDLHFGPALVTSGESP